MDFHSGSRFFGSAASSADDQVLHALLHRLPEFQEPLGICRRKVPPRVELARFAPFAPTGIEHNGMDARIGKLVLDNCFERRVGIQLNAVQLDTCGMLLAELFNALLGARQSYRK